MNIVDVGVDGGEGRNFDVSNNNSNAAAADDHHTRLSKQTVSIPKHG